MEVVSAHDVAFELRRQLPGLGVKKLHKLLYYAQGHHLAHFGQPLFREAVTAWDMGPVVSTLWKAEQEGRVPGPPRVLDNGQLNTVAYVISRYGRLTGRDLELLSHAEAPWQAADAGREPRTSPLISHASMRDFFRSEAALDDEQRRVSPLALAPLIAGAQARRALPETVDDPAEIERRIRALR